MAKAHLEILDAIGSMTVIELAEFIKALEAKFGVSAASMAVAAPAGAAAAAAPAQEEARSEYKVELVDAGPEKIKTIKAIRSVTVNGAVMALGDAKAKAESAPCELFDVMIPKEEAEKLKKALEEVGAKVKLS